MVELVGFEPTSGEGTTSAFYMFIAVCCRVATGTETTMKLHRTLLAALVSTTAARTNSGVSQHQS